jgi:hypothetical protein
MLLATERTFAGRSTARRRDDRQSLYLAEISWFFPLTTAGNVRVWSRQKQHEEHMITFETKVCIAGEIVTLGDVIEMN